MSRLFLAAVLVAGCAASTLACAAEPANAAQVSEKNGVKITAQPHGMAAGAKTWEFEVRLETHAHALNEDLAQASRLVANGKEYAPLAWDGTPPGGHHRKGLLRFAAPEPRPTAMELRIRVNGERAPRTFTWPLRAAAP